MGILNFIKNISPTELILIVVILFLLFGSRVVVKLGKTSGETVREIKRVKKSFMEAVEDEEPKKEGGSK